jgi:putative toxin-antitoxin system antitoxin component (TIGR02293 family)
LGHYRRFIGVFAAKRKARFHAERQQLQFAYNFGQMAQAANGVATSNSRTFAPDTIESRLQTASHGLAKVYNGSTISDLTKFGLTMVEIYRFVAPRRTLARSVSKGEPLTVEENDNALRVVRIFEMAAQVFGEAAKALSWLRSPNRSMDSVIPIDLLGSETGAMLIEQALNRIDYGIYV